MLAVEPTVTLALVLGLVAFVIAFLKGAFGGGFGILGIPVLAVVIDPLPPV